jgi:hypothetical protein
LKQLAARLVLPLMTSGDVEANVWEQDRVARPHAIRVSGNHHVIVMQGINPAMVRNVSRITSNPTTQFRIHHRVGSITIA